ncbi:RING/FYVE/PHD zinc finger superfamily protein isoform X2 [Wolffia australiana]
MQPGGDYAVPYYAPSRAAAPPGVAGEFAGGAPPQSFASAPPYSQFSPSDFHSFNFSPASHESGPTNPPVYSPAQAQNPAFQSYNPSGYSIPPAESPSSLVHQPPAGPYFSYDQPLPYHQSFDHGIGGSFAENSPRYGAIPDPIYGRGYGNFDRQTQERKADNSSVYERNKPYDDLLGEGVYAYDGGRSEPYGARGTAPARSSSSSSRLLFDDYGRSLGFSSSPGKEQLKVVKAVPTVETQQDVKHGVQKFRVKLLSEGSGQSSMDVLCQIGLDGIRMLDPSSNRTLRIYPLETVTRTEVTDSSTFAFWSKSSVDFEPKRIRLQSSSYTTSTLLDIVTAATIQFKEMGGKDAISRGTAASEAARQAEQAAEKKKGFADWINRIKPINEEKDHWVPDEAVTKCTSCGTDFGAFVRRHHCRNCGDIFCDKCTSGRIALTADEQAQPVRVCDRCLAEVTQRLSNAKETANRPAASTQSHEDLARKLQEEMEKNKRVSSGSSKPSGKRTREVACPTCTVHLQVQVPSSGSTTVECGVCQHPFLVNAS